MDAIKTDIKKAAAVAGTTTTACRRMRPFALRQYQYTTQVTVKQ